MSTEPQIDVGAAIRMIAANQPATIDESIIRKELEGVSVQSAAAVAKIFGVSYTTIKTSWRPGSMPGDPKNKSWPLGEILIWLLKRNSKNSPAPPNNGVVGDRKRDAEIRKVEAEAQLREIAVEQKEGRFIAVDWVKSEITAAFGRIRDGIMGIGRKCQPQLPKKQAVELRETIDRQCEITLNAVADDLLESIDQRDEEENDGDSQV
jgi:hypothetical protein